MKQSYTLNSMKKRTKSRKHKVLTRNGYVVSKLKLTAEEIEQIRKDLTVEPQTHPDYCQEAVPFKVFTESEKSICMPRYYGVAKFGQPLKTLSMDGVKVDMTFNGDLRDKQKPIINSCMKDIKNNGGGIISLYCGCGKTVLAIYLACQLKLKTLVVVHKTFLQDQWVERIEQFTNAKIGLIRQDKIDIEGKDIVIGMLQSISMKDYDASIFNEFGLVVYDECFPAKECVITENGPISIASLYQKWKSGEKLPLIRSYNEQRQRFEYRRMTYGWEKTATELVNVKFGKRAITCTPNHKFLTTTGYKEAINLTSNDTIICNYDTKYHSSIFTPNLNSDQLQVFLGSFLGKGSVTYAENTYKLRAYGTTKEYIDWKAHMFNSTCYGTDTFYMITTGFILDNKIGLNKNNCQDWVVEQLDARGIAVWLMDSIINTTDTTLVIGHLPNNNVTKELLVQKLTEFNITASLDQNTIIIERNFNQESLLYPYLHRSMRYKMISHDTEDIFRKHNRRLDWSDKKTRKLQHNISKQRETCDVYKWNHNFSHFGTAKVREVNKTIVTKSLEKVYDIEVEGNHNFIINSKNGNGPVVHNCHHVGSKVFSNALRKLGGKYTIGLSATPFRKDGLTKVINWYLGDIIYRLVRKGDKNVEIKMFNYESNDELFKVQMQNGKDPRTGKWKKMIGIAKMTTSLSKIKSRNEFIVSIINTLRKQYERRILILSGRRDHLDVLKAMVDEAIKQEEEEGLVDIGEYNTAFYRGGMKKFELQDSSEAEIIFATYSMAAEGLDIDRLNTLILATPKVDIEQSIGRVMRKPIKEGDIKPVIIDIVDQLEKFDKWGSSRRTYYSKKGYDIETYQAYNDRCVGIKDYLLRNGAISDNMADDEIRKQFLIHKYGQARYDLYEECGGFPDDDINKSTQTPALIDIMKIDNHANDTRKIVRIANDAPIDESEMAEPIF